MASARLAARGAPLDLDEGDEAAVLGHQVDLARPRLHPLAHDPPSVLAEEHRRLGLAHAPLEVGRVALLRGAGRGHSPFSSSARA